MKLVSSKGRTAAPVKNTKKSASSKSAPKKAAPAKPPKSGKKKGKAAGIVVGSLAALIVIGAGVAGYAAVDKVRKIDTILPGVTINGVNVSGMTEQEALAALGDAVPDDLYASLTLPDGNTVTVTPADVGIASSAESLAEKAMAYGRSGNPVTDAIAYYKGLGSLELTDDIFADYDSTVISNRISEAVDAYNVLSDVEPCVVSEDRITLVKGAGIAPLDKDELTKMLTDGLMSSLEDGKPWARKMQPSRAPSVDLDEVYESIYVEPVSAMFDKETGGLTESVTGVSFDLDAAKAAYAAAEDGETLTIDYVYTEPAVTAENLEEVLFRDQLYNCVTTLSGSSSNRITNIRLAAESINGIILNPGDVFSYNNALGERTEAKGYKVGISYIGGRSVPDIGGGICQVSSALYCCAIYNNLEIVERQNHMFLVSYLPLRLPLPEQHGLSHQDRGLSQRQFLRRGQPLRHKAG